MRFNPSIAGRGHLDAYEIFVGNDTDAASLATDEQTLRAGKSMDLLLAHSDGPTTARVKLSSVESRSASRCRRLIVLNRDHYRATGNWSLHLGYPMLYWKLPSYSLPRWAPLFLWKISIELDGKYLYISRPDEEDPTKSSRKRRDPELPRYNPFLKALLMREQNVSVDLPTDTVEFGSISTFVSKFAEQWARCDTSKFQSDLHPFTSPKNGVGPAIYPYATIGRGSFQGEAIAEDLKYLEEQMPLKGDIGCLDYLFSRPVENDEDEAKSPREVERFAVTATDPSQEKILLQSQSSKVTLVQGPPGTGKSQTIVNLIGAALARKERVVVACHQDAALSIVKKRLDERNLGHLAVKINDPIQDRKRVINSIRDLAANTHSYMTEVAIDVARSENSGKIMQTEKYLDHANQKFYGRQRNIETAYGDLLAAVYEAKQVSFNVYKPKSKAFLNNEVFGKYKSLAEAKEPLSMVAKYVNDIEECDYDQNPWRSLKQLSVDKNALRGILEQVLDDLPAKKTNGSKVHDVTDIWYAEHPLLISHIAGFTKSPTLQMAFCEAHGTLVEHLSGYLNGSAMTALLDKLRQGNVQDELKTYVQKLDCLDKLINVEVQRRNSPIIKALHSLAEIELDVWVRCCRAAIAYGLLERLGDVPKPYSILGARNTLRSALASKRNDDLEYILRQFTEAQMAADALREQRLLRVRSSRHARKTELRTLYHEAYSSVSKIYPVLLTSFETACKLLPMQPEVIDTLIIDEASQVYTSDALALFYRAKRAVVSGDDMQMPPTDYFALAETDEYSSNGTNNGVASEQSLLEALSIPIGKLSASYKMLKVHYRSSFPELIQFSNHAFYDGALSVPPTNASPLPFCPTPIKLEHVRGTFRNGVNQVEVEKVISVLKGIWQYGPSAHSVGVIVANVKQRDQLLLELENEAMSNAEFGRHRDISTKLYKNDMFEGLFVRSIEHVQGDERDIIVYSTTYGPDRRNYGPLSQKDKGRRRLNVATTRAKMAMVVITSLIIKHISDVTEDESYSEDGEARERWFFWKYMNYAQAVSCGNNALADEVLTSLSQSSRADTEPLRVSVGLPDNEFEQSVGDFLICHGYHVDYQVGEAGFRIDIGIKSKPTDRQYICGIECDGATYHSGYTARHRDIWRQELLEGKGWKIARVWSTDWFDHGGSERAQNKLLEDIACLSS